MSDYFWLAVSIGSAVVASGATAGWMKYAETRRAVRELRAEVNELRQKVEARHPPEYGGKASAGRVNGNGHDKLSLLQSNLSEQALFDIGSLIDEHRVLGEKLDYVMGRWAHVRRGGSPDDRADKWGNSEGGKQ